VTEEFDIATIRQRIAVSVIRARQLVENYRALSEMTPVEITQPAPPPHVWFGFIMLVRRPMPSESR
jgi:hypothetical protein